MKKTKKRILLVAIFVISIGILVLLTKIMINSLSNIPTEERDEMIEYYSNDENYIKVVGKVAKVRQTENKPLYIVIECKESDKFFFLKIRPELEELLNKTGLYFEGDGDTYYSFVIAPKVWWPGWDKPIVAVYSEDGNMTYLDFETGKSVYLEYIRNM